MEKIKRNYLFYLTLSIMILSTMIFLNKTYAETTLSPSVGLPSQTCILDIDDSAEEGESVVLVEGNCKKNQEFSGKIEKIVNGISGLAGAISVAFIVYGGFKYIMSSGDPRRVEEAKGYIFYAGSGLFVVLLFYMILNTVLGGVGFK